MLNRSSHYDNVVSRKGGAIMAEFVGVYAPYIEQYINFKRNLGYSFECESVFKLFDRFTLENNMNTLNFPYVICRKWRERRPNESDIMRYKRVNYIRNFLTYLNQLGYSACLPEPLKMPKTTFTPYIFSYDEIARFFKACDSIEITPFSDVAYILPALFRLIYGCGLRSKEALALRCKDVDLDQQYIIIRNSKNGKDRMLPLEKSLINVLAQYKRYYLVGCRDDDYFFTKKNNEPCGRDGIYRWFRKILFAAGISHGGKGVGPRLHDFRHTFSVHSLIAMSKAGLDLYYSLPILSTFLGHQSLEATDQYVRLTSDIYPGLIQEMNKLCAYVFPEVNKQ